MKRAWVGIHLMAFFSMHATAQPRLKDTVSKKSYAISKEGYSIEGDLKGYPEGKKIMMNLYDDQNDKFITRDSAIVYNGKFKINGYVPEGPRFYYMTFGDIREEGKIIRMAIDNNEHITIQSSDVNKIKHGYLEEFVNIGGSPSFQSWAILATVDITYRTSLRNIDYALIGMKDSLGFDSSMVKFLLNQRERINNDFFYEIFKDDGPWRKKAKLLMLDNIWFRDANHPAVYSKLYNMLDSAEKDGYYGKIFKSLKDLCVGQPFPFFSLPDCDGKLITSNSIIGKSKVTLVQFWHTGISGLRSNQEELMNYYKKYHDKGLSIIGVSSDTDSLEWKIRVQATKLPWVNVSDLKGSDGVAETIYHEGRPRPNWRPVNVLLDADGKIVAWDVDGVVLQWYLRKYLDNEKK